MYRVVEHKHTDFYMYDNKDNFIFLVQKECIILWYNYLVEARQNVHINYISSMIMFTSYLMHTKIKQTE